jgi:hypothetical protein
LLLAFLPHGRHSVDDSQTTWILVVRHGRHPQFDAATVIAEVKKRPVLGSSLNLYPRPLCAAGSRVVGLSELRSAGV